MLVKFTQGDIRYMPASGAGRGLFMIRGGDSRESAEGRGWRKRESNPRTRFPPAEPPVMWMLLGCVPVEMGRSSAAQAWGVGLGRLILGRVLLSGERVRRKGRRTVVQNSKSNF